MRARVAASRIVTLAMLLAAGCARGGPDASSREAQPLPAPGAGRTLVIISGGEPQSFAAKPLQQGAADTRSTHAKPLFNAALVYLDEHALPRPFLAQALPELGTASWTVSADGTMETSYRLKPGLTWHDRQPLTAADFVFAWRIYATPEFGVSDSAGFR